MLLMQFTSVMVGGFSLLVFIDGSIGGLFVLYLLGVYSPVNVTCIRDVQLKDAYLSC